VAEEIRKAVIHGCPRPGKGVTTCCGQSPFELDPMSRMTSDPALVTCAPRSETVAYVRLDKLPDHANKGKWSTLVEQACGQDTLEDHQQAADGLRQMAKDAAEQTVASKKCIHGEFMLWQPWSRALIPGHIYSEDGLREARISSCCEYHFDKMFDDDWVDVLTGEPGDMHPYRRQWITENPERVTG